MHDVSKQCTGCGETKPLDDFHLHRGRHDGRVSQCKACVAPKHRQWKTANPERAREAVAKWNRENPEAKRAMSRATQRRWREAHPFQHAARKRLCLTSKGATPETVDYAVVLMGDPCSYCAGPAGTLDHIEAGGANSWENLTAACRRCNTRKRRRPLLNALLELEPARS